VSAFALRSAKRAGGSGALFPKHFADFSREKIPRRTQIEKSDRSCEFAPEPAYVTIAKIPKQFRIACVQRRQTIPKNTL
jgi:hypothetical protein